MTSYYGNDGWRHFIPDGTIVAKAASDLVDIPANTLVQVDGAIVVSETIDIPVGVKFQAVSPLSFIISSAEVMFRTKVGTSSGIFWTQGMIFQMTSPTGKFLEYQGNDPHTGASFSTLVFRDTVFFNIPDLGDINDPYYVEGIDLTYNNVGTGFKFNGTVNTSIRFKRVDAPNFGDNGILFRKGDNLTVNKRVQLSLGVDLPAGTTSMLCDFEESNFPLDNAFEIVGSFITRNGVEDPLDANYTVIPYSSRKSLWEGNVGLLKTKTLGQWRCSSETTTPLSVGVQQKALGGFTYSNLVHFSDGGGGTQTLTLDNANAEQCEVIIEGQFKGGSGDELEAMLRVNKGGLGTIYEDYYVDLQPVHNFPQQDDRMTFRIFDIVLLEDGDIPELWVANTSDNTNATLTQGSAMIVKGL